MKQGPKTVDEALVLLAGTERSRSVLHRRWSVQNPHYILVSYEGREERGWDEKYGPVPDEVFASLEGEHLVTPESVWGGVDRYRLVLTNVGESRAVEIKAGIRRRLEQLRLKTQLEIQADSGRFGT